jgi:hypothetical protein
MVCVVYLTTACQAVKRYGSGHGLSQHSPEGKRKSRQAVLQPSMKAGSCRVSPPPHLSHRSPSIIINTEFRGLPQPLLIHVTLIFPGGRALAAFLTKPR